jgi:ATP-dependent Lhr-like helicase
VGRRTGLWHGDVGPAARRRIQADPPDLLLTTPESLEVMLISARVEHARLFADVRAVVVDEIHAFGGDDRGWHLLAVLERVTRLAGRELQRVGLSATVGNADGLLAWLAGACRGSRRVVRSTAGFEAGAEVAVDFVGNDENAATLVSTLYRGEKRLVFCDSRSGAESLAALVRLKGTATYVSHSSLSADERRQTEWAFAESSDCVIVATSTLELGVDIGDLDRVVQIDAPARVASFLQRLGRTGRRPGSVRNCLFLTRNTAALVRAVALRQLWQEGYVESVQPPPSPLHLFAQQILALCLQERRLAFDAWQDWIGRHAGFSHASREERDAILAFLIARRFIFDEDGEWSIGNEAEREFGWRHFVDLVSAFTAEGLFTVMHGDVEIGSVHQLTFALKGDSGIVLLLGGRPWTVQHIDWTARVAFVVPTQAPGQSRWLGDGVPLGFDLCQMIAAVLAGAVDVPANAVTRRAAAALAEARAEYHWLAPEGTTVKTCQDGRVEWWTFAGARANACLAASLTAGGLPVRRFDNFSIALAGAGATEAGGAVRQVQRGAIPLVPPVITDEALEGLKFSVCLPPEIARRVLERRAEDRSAVKWILEAGIRVAREGDYS